MIQMWYPFFLLPAINGLMTPSEGSMTGSTSGVEDLAMTSLVQLVLCKLLSSDRITILEQALTIALL